MTITEDRPTVTSSATVTVQAGHLLAALGNVSAHASRDRTIPALCVVQVTWDAEGLLLAATDRFSLAWERVACVEGTDAWGEGVLLLASEDVRSVLARLKAMPARSGVRLSFDGPRTMTFDWLDGMATFHGLDAEYVRWRSLIPEGEPTALESVALGEWQMHKFHGLRRQDGDAKAAKRAPLCMKFHNKMVRVDWCDDFHALVMSVTIA